MLTPLNRLTSREDFQRVTKSKTRSHTKTLTGYLLSEPELTEPKIGFIVAGNIGSSVKRHRVSRQLRHASRKSIHILLKVHSLWCVPINAIKTQILKSQNSSPLYQKR